jgi:hypothetical protein
MQHREKWSRGAAVECSPGREAGVRPRFENEPRSGERVPENLSHLRRSLLSTENHGLTPVATFFRRSAAQL